jgi:hypothetical protein
MAGSEKFYEMAFYAAESGWQRALNWLDDQYLGDVRNRFWNGTTFEEVLDIDEVESVGIPLADDNNTEYFVKIEIAGTAPVPGYGTSFRRVNYKLKSEGSGPSKARSVVEVTAGKVFDMGGY